MSLIRKFTSHPAAVGETYVEHFMSAMSFSFTLLRAAFVCAVHALLPFLFEKTGSEYITLLHTRMVTSRSRPQGRSFSVQAREPAHTPSIGRPHRHENHLQPMLKDLQKQGVDLD